MNFELRISFDFFVLNLVISVINMRNFRRKLFFFRKLFKTVFMGNQNVNYRLES